ncbi:MAG: nitroreductase/quinone reductase family protein [Anaerolineales bacterium]
MLDTPNFTSAQMQTLRRVFHAMNYFMVFMWKLGLGRFINCWPSVGGRIMVIHHRGRKSGRQYLTPVNYAIVDSEIYSAAGFGSSTDWYRNLLADPCTELWLPQGRRRARAIDVSGSPNRVSLLRAISIASGFAAPLLGVDQRKLTDEQMSAVGKDYRLIHFRLEP